MARLRILHFILLISIDHILVVLHQVVQIELIQSHLPQVWFV